MEPDLVVATDFSPAAINAAQYACQMANALGGRVHLLHAFVVPVAYGEMPMPIIPAPEMKAIAEEKMNRELVQLSKENNLIDITGATVYGDVNDALADWISKESSTFKIAILGNSGSAADSGWLGSNTLDVLRNSSIPALTISENHVWNGKPKHICFATDFTNDSNEINSAGILTIVKWLDATLHLLHIITPEAKKILSEGKIAQSLALLNPISHTVEADNIDEAIHDFVVSEKMDWLLVVPRHHGFFTSIFHHSHTKAVVTHSAVPVMAIHEIS